MQIQSVSIDVPAVCPNNCAFCVSKLAQEEEKGMMRNIFTDDALQTFNNGLLPKKNQYLVQNYMARLGYLRDCNINTVVLTGSRCEPLFNVKYLNFFFRCNELLKSPFKNIELQTSGIDLIKYFDYLHKNSVQTISLSLSSLNSIINQQINIIHSKYEFDIAHLCKAIKDEDFNLRLSLNLNNVGFPGLDYNPNIGIKNRIKQYIEKAKELGADQLTLRHLYSSTKNTIQDQWISKNCSNIGYSTIQEYIKEDGRILNRLPFGAIKYDLNGMSVILDEDCMSKENIDDIRYIILRRNGKLYSRWDSEASLIF